MRNNLWMLFVVGLATGFLSEKLLVASQTSPLSDDLYLAGQSSGGFPSDDEDDEDFSGSGIHPIMVVEEVNTTKFVDVTDNTAGTTATPESTVPPTVTYVPPTVTYEYPDETGCLTPDYSSETDYSHEFPTNDSVVEDTIEAKVGEDLGDNRMQVENSKDITSEGMWHRTDVLSAVIACGVVGFLCAIFLVLLLAYRMKKKDEGSYVLGVAKVPPSAYLKAPAKEFYA
ncbi:hypothetical protein CRUP_010779 [Coryphaenoides rupestris]|nr:hypothetical protein CRUP_010779 [Coryphaenoides rupestris]